MAQAVEQMPSKCEALNHKKKKKMGWASMAHACEAEIRRITVQSQTGIRFSRPYLKKKPFTKKGWWSP
jgi:hypothetical protein